MTKTHESGGINNAEQSLGVDTPACLLIISWGARESTDVCKTVKHAIQPGGCKKQASQVIGAERLAA